MSKESCKVAYCRGVIDGYQQKRSPYPGKDKLPPILPEFSRPYRIGYGYGESIKGLLDAIDNTEDID